MLNRKIYYFVSAVENGSFSGAAKEYYLSQSAISQQIVKLEDELDIRLFDRSGCRPVLTSTGEYYFQECKKIIDRYEEIKVTSQIIEKGKSKVLKIGITGPIEIKHLPKIIIQYKMKYDAVHIDIKKITFMDGINLLENGMLDVVFGITNDFEENDEIRLVNLLNQKVCVICSKDHPWANRKSVNRLEIVNQPIISFSKNIGYNFYCDYIQTFEKDNATPYIIQEVNELEELLFAVKINQGIALASRGVITEEDDVCMIDIENTHHHADFCLRYLKNNDKEFLNAFIDNTISYFSSLTL